MNAFAHVLGESTWKGCVILLTFLAVFHAPVAFALIYFCYKCFIEKFYTLQVWQCIEPLLFPPSLADDYVKYAKQSAQLCMRCLSALCLTSRLANLIPSFLVLSFYNKCTVKTVKSVIVYFFRCSAFTYCVYFVFLLHSVPTHHPY